MDGYFWMHVMVIKKTEPRFIVVLPVKKKNLTKYNLKTQILYCIEPKSILQVFVILGVVNL